MLQLKFPCERKLDLPIYSLTEKKDNVKSCFVNENRVDTVRPFFENQEQITERTKHDEKQKVLTKK